MAKNNVYDKVIINGSTLISMIVSAYNANRESGMNNTQNMENILETYEAELDGKNERSIRAKLLREKNADGTPVYVADPKVTKQKTNDGPSKKELASELRELTGHDLEGLEATTKGVISELIEAWQDKETTKQVA